MSFLSKLGLQAIGGSEGPHGTPEIEYVPKVTEKLETYQHPKIGITLKDFNARFFFINPIILLDHDKGYYQTKMRISSKGNMIVADIECPDCDDENDGCSHCEREHLDDHKCKVLTPSFIDFLEVLDWPDSDTSTVWFYGKYHFIEAVGWKYNHLGSWHRVSLPIDHSIKGNFFCLFKV